MTSQEKESGKRRQRSANNNKSEKREADSSSSTTTKPIVKNNAVSSHDASVPTTSSPIFTVPRELVNAVKLQMIPLGQNRSDVVDVRENELGLKECHIVAALLGMNTQQEGNRVLQQQHQQQIASSPKDKKPQKQKDDEVVATEEEIQQQQQQQQQQTPLPIRPFFQRVHTMRLQLGASIHENNNNKINDDDHEDQNQFCGGFDLIFKAIRQLHSPFLRTLDLSRNRFFFYKHFNDKQFKGQVTMEEKKKRNDSTKNAKLSQEEKRQELAIAKKYLQELRTNEIKVFFDTVVSCKNLVILNVSHNVGLRSDGAVAVCEAATRLPNLKALLMERCSIDDRGAMEIARFFAQGRLPSTASSSSSEQQQQQQQFDDNDNTAKSTRRSAAVLLTLDLGWNRIGPAGLLALSKAIPDSVGLGAERQSPPLVKDNAAKK